MITIHISERSSGSSAETRIRSAPVADEAWNDSQTESSLMPSRSDGLRTAQGRSPERRPANQRAVGRWALVSSKPTQRQAAKARFRAAFGLSCYVAGDCRRWRKRMLQAPHASLPSCGR